jgi:phosphate transport system protein
MSLPATDYRGHGQYPAVAVWTRIPTNHPHVLEKKPYPLPDIRNTIVTEPTLGCHSLLPALPHGEEQLRANTTMARKPMSQSNLPTHLEASLQRSMNHIRAKVAEMAGRGERALKTGLRALLERDRRLAYSVILHDQYIDELELELDRLCLEFLVRQQPVGTQLRFVYATIKINKDLERIGDYAESVARQVLTVSQLESPPPYEKFVELAELAIHMVHDTVQAFLAHDADLAKQTISMEEQADALRNAINAELVVLEREGKLPLEALAPLTTIARRFERVTDQAKNICEDVLYMCTGEFIKHPGTEAFRILFVDAANDCLSQMAETIGNALGVPRFVFDSAGVAPQEVDPRTARFLASKGLDISRQAAKSLEQVPHLEHHQVIVALDAEAKRAFPTPPTKTVCLTWKIKNPSQVQGSAEEIQAAYEAAYQLLTTDIRDLVEAIQGNISTNTKEPCLTL